ncbi:MAG: hypothetical protein AAF587_41480 [Bacteroidota bacterium]
MKKRISFLYLIIFLICSPAVFSQANRMAGKTIGLYISSQGFSFDETFTMKISQFLTVGEDRSYLGKIKPELIIRLGWMFSEQLQQKSKADTVIFLNADLPRGRVMKESFDSERGFLTRTHEELSDLHEILVINPFEMRARIHKSVYIRSNRMITDRVPIPVLKASFLFLDPIRPRLAEHIDVCLDDQKSEAPTEYFYFHKKESPMGSFFSKSFSQWWEQIVLETQSNCE